MEQGGRGLDLHALAERKVPNRLPDEALEVKQLDELVPGLPEVVRMEPVDRPKELVRVERRQVPLELVAVAHDHRDLAEVGGLAPRRDMTEDGRIAARRVQEAAEHLERRRLAGTVWPEEADNLAGLDDERDAIDRVNFAMLAPEQASRGRAQPRLAHRDAERLAELGDADRGFGHGRAPRGRGLRSVPRHPAIEPLGPV